MTLATPVAITPIRTRIGSVSQQVSRLESIDGEEPTTPKGQGIPLVIPSAPRAPPPLGLPARESNTFHEIIGGESTFPIASSAVGSAHQQQLSSFSTLIDILHVYWIGLSFTAWHS